MRKCDFCAQKLPNGECNYAVLGGSREDACKHAIKYMREVLFGTNISRLTKCDFCIESHIDGKCDCANLAGSRGAACEKALKRMRKTSEGNKESTPKRKRW